MQIDWVRKLSQSSWVKSPPWLARLTGVIIVTGALLGLGLGILVGVVVIIEGTTPLIGLSLVITLGSLFLLVSCGALTSSPLGPAMKVLYTCGVIAALVAGLVYQEFLLAVVSIGLVFVCHLMYFKCQMVKRSRR